MEICRYVNCKNSDSICGAEERRCGQNQWMEIISISIKIPKLNDNIEKLILWSKLYFLYYCNECNMIMGSPPPLRPLSASPRKRWAGDKTMIASRTNEMRRRRSLLVIKLIFISVDYAETFVAIPCLCWECEESINICLQRIPLTTYAEAAGRMTSLGCPTQSPEGESVKDY